MKTQQYDPNYALIALIHNRASIFTLFNVVENVAFFAAIYFADRRTQTGEEN